MPCIHIIGQGLAGSVLAWQLHWHGVPFTLVDRDEPVTSSKIAAGLMTPITGKRLAQSWRYEELYATAVQFYRRVEAETGETVFIPRVIARLFADEAEQKRYLARCDTEFAGQVRPLTTIDEQAIRAPLGGFEMPHGGQLLVAKFLELTRLRFQSRYQSHFPEDDPANWRVFCEGIAARSNSLFAHVPFRPAKGDILTLRIRDFAETRVLNQQGTWLLPLGGDRFRAGATYDWHDLSPTPSAAGRDEILARLRQFVRVPVKVVDHQAAVRPIVEQQRPAIGFHPTQPGLAFFNGFSSKGSLWAPFCAEQLVNAILYGTPIDAEIDVARFAERSS